MVYPLIERIQTIWAKHKTLVIINSIALFVIIFFVIPPFLPKPPLNVRTPNLQSTEQSVGNITIDMAVSQPEVPATIRLYRLNENAKRDAEIFQSMTRALNVTRQLTPTLYINDAGDTLGFESTLHIITYNKYFDVMTIPLTTVNTDEAKKVAEEWLKTIGFTDVTANALSTRYFKNDDAHEGLEETDPGQATQVQFAFSRKLDGLDVVLGASSAEPAFIMVANVGVIQAKIPAFAATFTQDTPRESLPFTTVLENIRNGRYTFSGQIPAVSENSQDTEPTRFKINATQLLYRVDTSQSAAIPYWNLRVTATLRNGQQIDTEITTPAVQL